MICPHCFKTIDDSATFCPHCNAYLGGETAPVHDEFVFCEGCGARLSPHDRTCPKCGRPAPGILSAGSSSSDLAAGRTASFPRLTQAQIDAAAHQARPVTPTAAQVISDSIDPSTTQVLDSAELEEDSQAGRKAGKRARRCAEGEDPYHKRESKFVKPIACVLVACALVGGAAYFVTEDPLGVMPDFYAWFERSASDTFPSRQLPQEGSVQVAGAKKQQIGMTDADVYQRLLGYYDQITQSFDSLETIINDYEYGFLANDRALREEKSRSAYDTRDTLDAVIKSLDELKLPKDSSYQEEVSNLSELAGWVRTRVDMYCASWDISLGFQDGERPSSHSDEILKPLRERSAEDQQARDNYFAHLDEYKPVEK
ncbi:MAG: zinc ribbon domain-containing protein [Coriobacteriaceae bacterium]|nr:zinc ribbon domain-containing protein [Coriobacteriaceae bacterium]